MIRFRAGNRHGAGSTPGSYSETTSTGLADASRELGVRCRIVAVDTAPEHGDGLPAALERSAMRLAVDTACHPAHDDETGGSKIPRERTSDRPPVRRARARSDDRNRRPVEQSRLRRSAQEELRRGIVDRREQGRKGRSRAAGCTGSPSRRGELSGHAIREGLGDVRRLDRGRACERRDRARDARDACTAASGEREPVDRAREELRCRLGSARRRRAGGARERRRTRSRTAADGSARRRGELRRAWSRHRNREIEAIEQRPRELLAIRREPLRRARAFDAPDRLALRTGTCSSSRRAETARGRARGRRRARRRRAVLERLPERLEHRARELRQLVHEEDSAVRERDLAGTRARPAADDRRRGRAVMRRAKRRDRDERASGGSDARNRVDARHLERLRPRQRRQDPRQPPRQHRLARARAGP